MFYNIDFCHIYIKYNYILSQDTLLDEYMLQICHIHEIDTTVFNMHAM